MLRSISMALGLAFLLAAASLARADEGESSEYKEAVNLGLSEFEQKNFLEARAQFTRAHAIDPSARTLRALGMVHFELKEYATSARYLSAALASSDRPLDDDKRSKAQALLKQAQHYIGRVAIDVQPSAQLVLDGKPIRFPDGHELLLDVGDHALEFKADGYIGERRTIKVQGGETETLRVRLVEVGAAISKAPGDDTPSERRPVYKSPWLWTIVGVVVAGAAAGTAIALTRKTEKRAEEPYLGMDGIAALRGVGK